MAANEPQPNSSADGDWRDNGVRVIKSDQLDSNTAQIPADRPFQAGARERLRQVVLDELTDIPEQFVYLPEPRDDRQQ